MLDYMETMLLIVVVCFDVLIDCITIGFVGFRLTSRQSLFLLFLVEEMC